MQTVNERLDTCRKILGVEYSPFGKFWDSSDWKTRAALLRISGTPSHLSGRKWSEISPASRAEIKRRSFELKDWLNRILGEGEKNATAH